MADVLKLAAVAVAAALAAVTVKKQAREIGVVVALAAGVLILGLALGGIEQVRGLVDTLSETAGLSPAVLAPVVKTTGIAIVTRIAAEVCRDAGEGGIASFTETAGAALALVVTLPLLEAVLQSVIGLL